MDNQVQNAIVNFIWGIADDCLRDVYTRGKYRDVILPYDGYSPFGCNVGGFKTGSP